MQKFFVKIYMNEYGSMGFQLFTRSEILTPAFHMKRSLSLYDFIWVFPREFHPKSPLSERNEVYHYTIPYGFSNFHANQGASHTAW